MKKQKKRAIKEHPKPAAPTAGSDCADNNIRATESGGITDILRSAWHSELLRGLLLVVLCIFAYLPAWHAGLIWDDDRHLTSPELRSVTGLVRIWTEPGATQQYYPLVHTVFWVEQKLWGESASAYHWVNILLHSFSALLLARILRQLKIPGAWLAAALFALHPVEVESVAWISELKNTLSGVFYLSAVLAYLEFDRSRNRGNYAVAFGLFLLGLMSKTVIASLPGALLVVFWWQRKKLSLKKDVLPLAPFFFTGIAAGLFTAWMERKFIGAVGSDFNFSLIERGLIAGRAICFYLGKLLWPLDLAFIYPRWEVSQMVWWQYLFPTALLLLLVLLAWRRWRGPMAGLLFFAGTLFPALGFFNVYPFRYSFVADHFQYLASLGPLVLAAAGISVLLRPFAKSKPMLEPAVCISLLLVLGTLSWKQCRTYKDAETLWRATLRINPHSWMAHNNLGHELLYKNGQTDEAIAHFEKSLEINPKDTEAHINLGNAFCQQRKMDKAILQYQKALEIKPDDVEAHTDLGLCLFDLGRVNEAVSQYKTALEIKPDYALAHYNLGNAFGQQKRLDEAIVQYEGALKTRPDWSEAHANLGGIFSQVGRLDEAIAQFQMAVQIQPNNAVAHYNFGNILIKLGRVNEAIMHYEQALKIVPDDLDAHYNLAGCYFQQGRIQDAIIHYQRAVDLKPDFAEAEQNLAWLLATSPEAVLRNGKKAVELAEGANRLKRGNNPDALRALAAAFAEAGQFDDALSTAQKANALAGAVGNKDLMAQLNNEIKRYQARLPLHD